ncbi:TRAP transporter substrate-binding protein [Nitrincola alkalisediminis]|uniref:TRAP transporter substrate-binding protein n=1 Tax=Nitrincola alkalisediminis TaxID=1366656 RepID=UPI001876B2C5|nr:TRAP transporter substrate-binding protein [Nitrincola alkalisediminis]
MKLRKLLLGLSVLSILPMASHALASEVKLRVHHFLPPMSPAHRDFIEPWCEKIKTESEGRLVCEIYPSMQLGGSPPQLINQVRDGIADIVWTLPGYTSGRFPLSEVFELPFMTAAQQPASKALWDFVEQYAQDREFRGLKPIGIFVNGANQIHLRDKQVNSLEDLKGMRIRAPSRMGNQMLAALGATPVGMPVPQMAESLSRGVIDGALVPWEVIPATRAHELTKFHAEADNQRSLVTSTMIFVMNQRKYDSLPDDLKAVIDANSGRETSAWISAQFEAANEAGRQAALGRGNTVYQIDADELQRWEAASLSAHQDWINDVNKLGEDGQALLDAAKALIEKYSTAN